MQNSDTKTVIILTMPRSGSSLLAGILHRLGVPMGSYSDLEKGQHLNRYGCYEDQWFQSISLNILFESRLLLDLTKRLNMDEERIKNVVQNYKAEIEEFVKENEQNTWGFKDPALIYSLPYFHTLFKNPYYIHLRRNTRDTAGSLYKTFRPSYWIPEMKEKFPLFKPRNRMRIILRSAKLLFTKQKDYNEQEVFEQVIERGHRRIERFLKKKNKHTFIQLENLLEEPERNVKELADFLDLDTSRENYRAALEFLDPNLVNSY